MKTLILLFPTLLLGMTCSSTQSAKMPSGPEVSAFEIIRLLSAGEHVYLNGKKIIGDLDFSTIENSYPEGLGTFRVEVPGSVTFIDCHFLGAVRAFSQVDKNVRLVTFRRNLSFVNCRFDQPVDLRSATVEGVSNWQKSVFKSECRMSGLRFERRADFEEADFIGPFQGQEMEFLGDANFLNAVFENTANFQKAQFHQTAQFGVVRFLDYVEFNSVWAQQPFLMNYGQFHGRAFFQNARFDDRTDFFKAHFQKTASLSKSRFAGEVTLRELTIDESFSLEKCRFTEPPAGWPELQNRTDGTVNLTDADIGR